MNSVQSSEEFVISPLASFEVWRSGVADQDDVAEEQPVAFEYNGISHAVMLATPADLEDFAVGFSLSEGIVGSRAEIFEINTAITPQGLIVRLQITSAAFAELKDRRRSLAGRTGCGLCGIESLEQVERKLRPISAQPPFPLAALYKAIDLLPAHQTLQLASGATHAACRVSRAGEISHVREDIGRHNALDKTLGAMAREQLAADDSALIITSRASLEMVQKSISAGFSTLAAVSAPTAGAVRMAQRLNLELIGFLRGKSCAVYTGKCRTSAPEGAVHPTECSG